MVVILTEVAGICPQDKRTSLRFPEVNRTILEERQLGRSPYTAEPSKHYGPLSKP